MLVANNIRNLRKSIELGLVELEGQIVDLLVHLVGELHLLGLYLTEVCGGRDVEGNFVPSLLGVLGSLLGVVCEDGALPLDGIFNHEKNQSDFD